jgi:hypothetical protein
MHKSLVRNYGIFPHHVVVVRSLQNKWVKLLRILRQDLPSYAPCSRSRRDETQILAPADQNHIRHARQ